MYTVLQRLEILESKFDVIRADYIIVWLFKALQRSFFCLPSNLELG